MRISTKVECGLIVIMDIALNSENGEIVALYNIAQRRNISIKYLEQIVTSLRQRNIVKGLKGSRGGYILSRPADRITVKEIVDAFDITLIGNEISEVNDDNNDITSVINEMLWDKMEVYLDEFTSSITLKDLIRSYKEHPKENDEPMYYI